MKKNISTLIFDFGNVLIDINMINFYDAVEKIMGIRDKDKVKKIETIMLQYETGQISTELFLNHLIQQSHIPVQARELVDAWNSILIGVPPDIPPLLLDLKTRYRTYILSNTNLLHIDWVQGHLKERYDIVDFETEYIHEAFYSHHLQLRKPNPEIYRWVENKIQTTGDEILFIDDLKENVLAARQAGWQAIQHPANTLLSDTLKSAGVE